MTNATLIKIALAKTGTSMCELERKMIEADPETAMSKQVLSKRLMSDKFSTEELERICSVLGCKYEPTIVFEDTVIK